MKQAIFDAFKQEVREVINYYLDDLRRCVDNLKANPSYKYMHGISENDIGNEVSEITVTEVTLD